MDRGTSCRRSIANAALEPHLGLVDGCLPLCPINLRDSPRRVEHREACPFGGLLRNEAAIALQRFCFGPAVLLPECLWDTLHLRRPLAGALAPDFHERHQCSEGGAYFNRDSNGLFF